MLHRFFVLLLAVLIAQGLGCGKQPVPIDDPGLNTDPSAIKPTRPGADDLRDSLEKAGWPESSARAVAELNADWFDVFTPEQPAHAEAQLVLLKGLHKHPALLVLLEQHPEVAGLLAAAKDPDRVYRTLVRTPAKDFDLVAGLYAQHAAPEDVSRLAEALERHGSLIVRLIRRGLLGAEILFLYPRNGESAGEYDRWLAEEMEARFTADNEDLAAFQVFLLDQGEAIRQRLRDDNHFHAVFRSELWPKLTSVVGPGGGWALYTGEPHLWDLLALSNGEKLLHEHGRLPITLLFDDGAYPADLHTMIRQALDQKDESMLQALVKFQNKPLFVKLLQRRLPSRTQQAALHKLLQAGKNVSDVLKTLNGQSDAALIEDLGPPPDGIQTWIPLYSTYYLGKKVYQNRDVSAMDWVLAVGEPLTMLAPELKLAGKGISTTAQALTKEAAKQTFKTTLKTEGKAYLQKQFTKQATRAGWKIATGELKTIGEKIAEKGLEHELASFGLTTVLSRLQEPFKNSLVNATTFEATNAVRILYTYSGLSRATFKRFTGLEARLFMRKDAQVFIRLENTIIGTASTAFINGLNEKIAAKTLEVFRDEERQRAQRQDVAAWWLLNGSGPQP